MTTKHKIVLVSFPFDDLSATKVRPDVRLTEPIGPHRHVVLAFITSRILDRPLKTDLVIDATQPGFSETGLRMASTLHLHRLMTVTTALFQRELGVIPPSMQLQINRRLRKLLGL